MKKHKEYKNSGIEWIDKIPTDWQVMKLKQLGVFSASGIDKKTIEDEVAVKMVNYTDIYGNKKCELNNNRNYMIVSCPQEKKRIHQVEKGDLIFTPSSETVEDIGLSALVNEYLPDTVYSYHVIRFQFKKPVSHSYKKYLCNNTFVLNQFSKCAKGTTRQILGRDDFKNIQVILPPDGEQQKASTYLDKCTSQIDNLISKKGKMIELLKEERTAIVNQAVTKGLDPKVEMKNSGIEWLGKVPKQWKVKKLKHVAGKVQTGITPPSENASYYNDGNIDWYTPGDFKESVQLRNSFRKINRLAIEKGVARVFLPYSVLLIGIGATLGKVGIVEKLSSSNQQINAITFSDKFNPFFGVYYLQAITNTVISLSNASTLAILNQTQTKDILVLVPPLEEQDKIVQYIQSVELKHAEIVNKEQEQIDLLKEFRTSLISEVVTGKIDVRGEINA